MREHHVQEVGRVLVRRLRINDRQSLRLPVRNGSDGAHLQINRAACTSKVSGLYYPSNRG